MEESKILLIMAGGGTEEEAIVKLTEKMGIADHVVITGFVENNLLLSFMKLADLVIIPSLFEGLGNVAIEGIMLKKKVLASDAGGLREILGDCNCGKLFQAGNAVDLQSKFIDAMEGNLTFNSEAGYAWYKEKFTPQTHIQNLIRVLKK